MPQAKVYSESGEATGVVEVSPMVFDVGKIKPELVHQVMVALRANVRRPYASTKTRGEVRGGGKKPWQQKGTGRARAGSIRSPLWRGGGVTFGPRSNRNFSKKINKREKRLALLSVLSDKFTSQKIVVLENIELPEVKTRQLALKLAALSGKLPELGRHVLLIVPSGRKDLFTAARNLPSVDVRAAASLNLGDLLAASSVIILKEALPIIEKKYLA